MFDDDQGFAACRHYDAAWEDYLDLSSASSGALVNDPSLARELEEHLNRCVACREAFEAARLSRDLLRGALEPAPEPAQAFAKRVLAGIREQESAGQQLWRPLEVLASRLALTAATLLLLLAGYVYILSPQDRSLARPRNQVTDGFPQPVNQPSNQDEILISLAEREHGR